MKNYTLCITNDIMNARPMNIKNKMPPNRTALIYFTNVTYSPEPIDFHQHYTNHLYIQTIDIFHLGTRFSQCRNLFLGRLRTRNTSAIIVTTPTPSFDDCEVAGTFPPV